MPEINIDMMRRTFEYIEAHPEEHYQGNWVEKGEDCGTTRCFAGTAAHLSPDYAIRLSVEDSYFTCHREEDGEEVEFSRAGAEILGLNDNQAEEMFFDAGTLDDLYALAKQYTGIDFRAEVTADA